MIEPTLCTPHEVDHQLSSACHRVVRSLKHRTLSGRRISSDHRIHWIASNSPGLFLAIVTGWSFCRLTERFYLQLYVVFLLCLVSLMSSIILIALNTPPSLTAHLYLVLHRKPCICDNF